MQGSLKFTRLHGVLCLHVNTFLRLFVVVKAVVECPFSSTCKECTGWRLVVSRSSIHFRQMMIRRSAPGAQAHNSCNITVALTAQGWQVKGPVMICTTISKAE